LSYSIFTVPQAFTLNAAKIDGAPARARRRALGQSVLLFLFVFDLF
jgi:hypothetical protein